MHRNGFSCDYLSLLHTKMKAIQQGNIIIYFTTNYFFFFDGPGALSWGTSFVVLSWVTCRKNDKSVKISQFLCLIFYRARSPHYWKIPISSCLFHESHSKSNNVVQKCGCFEHYTFHVHALLTLTGNLTQILIFRQGFEKTILVHYKCCL